VFLKQQDLDHHGRYWYGQEKSQPVRFAVHGTWGRVTFLDRLLSNYRYRTFDVCGYVVGTFSIGQKNAILVIGQTNSRYTPQL
jgi:hypothetical protein